MSLTESKYEIDRKTYYDLLNDNKTLEKFGKSIAINSFFKPKIYGYYGCKLEKDKENSKYYLVWKHNEEKYV